MIPNPYFSNQSTDSHIKHDFKSITPKLKTIYPNTPSNLSILNHWKVSISKHPPL